jgi:hypothetical protein
MQRKLMLLRSLRMLPLPQTRTFPSILKTTEIAKEDQNNNDDDDGDANTNEKDPQMLSVP